jgi:hypothetical protein
MQEDKKCKDCHFFNINFCTYWRIKPNRREMEIGCPRYKKPNEPWRGKGPSDKEEELIE